MARGWPEDAQRMPGGCLEDAQRMPGGCLEDAQRMPGGCLEGCWSLVHTERLKKQCSLANGLIIIHVIAPRIHCLSSSSGY